jgi:signal transduction histidine kinase
MHQPDQELIALIVAGTIMLLLLGIFIISFLFFYQKRHNNHISEKENLKSEFKQELLKTRIEIQESTLNDISREIHDNITQVLSFVKLNLGMIDGADQKTQAKIIENRELVAQTINDLRNLSKSMSFEHIAQLGLVSTLEKEVERINNSGVIKVEMNVSGDSYSLGEQRELVLFRIFQEALNNTLKHSGAGLLKISLQYSEQMFNLTLEDNGAGFSTTLHSDNIGAGLRNMNNRAALIGAVTSIESSPGKGCCIKVILDPFEQQLYESSPSNSIG